MAVCREVLKVATTVKVGGVKGGMAAMAVGMAPGDLVMVAVWAAEVREEAVKAAVAAWVGTKARARVEEEKG
jgi:hypothetical protein